MTVNRFLPLLLLPVCVFCQMRLVDNGYTNVVVSISPDISAEETNPNEVVRDIKKWLQLGSQQLFKATRKLAYLAEVKILIPQSWASSFSDEVEESIDVAFEDGAIRVLVANPLHGDIPYTVQARGCGERGEFIHVTPNFVANVNVTAGALGPPGNLFVHEWSRFRYGVFEEFGFPGDSLYPLFYYESQYGVNGYEVTLKPSFCTNFPLQGHMEDLYNGGSCAYESDSGLPDKNCIFVVEGSNNKVRSSFMAINFLQSAEDFCDDGGSYLHDATLPTRQNDLCGGRSAWAVVAANDDFADVEASVDEVVPDIVFSILSPINGDFVLVLDRSSSMNDNKIGTPRMDRLKQACIEWIQLELQDDSFLGITSFSSDSSVEAEMTSVDETSRPHLVDAILSLDSYGGTCFGGGIRLGLEVLQRRREHGGVMIFLTDGVYECPDSDVNQNLDDPALLDEITASGVRMISMAFGDRVTDDLENLAVLTNGKTYFIPDGSGVEDLSNALVGSLTYQPSLPTSDVNITIVRTSRANYTAESADQMLDGFIIDKTLGKDIRIQISFGDSAQVVEVKLFREESQAEPVTLSDSSTVAQVFIADIADLPEGSYGVGLRSTGQLDYLDVAVTSKAKPGTLPFETRCWINAESIDLLESPLAIYAQVTQGNSPVIYADVMAQIQEEGSTSPIEISLFDDGENADLTAHDGIYGNFFTGFDEDSRYTLKCFVRGVAEVTEVIQGGLDKAYPLDPLLMHPDICCGSDALTRDVSTEKTGRFQRHAVGGSIKVSNSSSSNVDVTPPGKIRDLRALFDRAKAAVTISFTSPGDDYGQGRVSSYEIRLSSSGPESLLTSFSSGTRLDPEALAQESDDLDPVAPGVVKNIIIDVVNGSELLNSSFGMEMSVAFAARAVDDVGNTGEVSNVVVVGISDVIDPGSINGLVINEVIESEAVVEIEFGATGDDGVEGKASSYELLVSTTSPMSKFTLIVDSMLASGSLEKPSQDLDVISVSVKVKHLAVGADKENFFTVRAVDNDGNVGPLTDDVGPLVVRDVYPPSAVQDLRASLIEEKDNGTIVFVEFTAPGDDFDVGTAASYNLSYSSASLPVLVTVTEDDLVDSSLLPVAAGTSVSGTFIASGKGPFFVTVTAVDDEGNISPVSNVAVTGAVDSHGEDKESLSVSELTFIILGILVVLGIAATATFFVIRNKRRKRRRDAMRLIVDGNESYQKSSLSSQHLDQEFQSGISVVGSSS